MFCATRSYPAPRFSAGSATTSSSSGEDSRPIPTSSSLPPRLEPHPRKALLMLHIPLPPGSQSPPHLSVPLVLPPLSLPRTMGRHVREPLSFPSRRRLSPTHRLHLLKLSSSQARSKQPLVTRTRWYSASTRALSSNAGLASLARTKVRSVAPTNVGGTLMHPHNCGCCCLLWSPNSSVLLYPVYPLVNKRAPVYRYDKRVINVCLRVC